MNWILKSLAAHHMPHRTRSHLLSFKITMSQRGALSEIPRPQPKAMSCHLYVSSARWTNAHDSTAHKSRHMFLHWTQHSFEWSQCLSREVLNEFCKQTRPKKTNHPEMLVSISSVIFLLFSLSMHLGVVSNHHVPTDFWTLLLRSLNINQLQKMSNQWSNLFRVW